MELLSIESVRTDSLPNRRTTLRSGFAFTRIVILLSRIIKPDDSIPRDIVCRVNITKTLRGRRRARAGCIYIRCAWKLPIRAANFWVSIWRCVPIGRIDIVRGSLPAPLPDTSRTFARTYGHNSTVLFARGIARELTQPCVVF